MIIPITTEADWLASLAGTPEWLPPRLRTVLVSPHPDDEVLGAGGLLSLQKSSGLAVTVVAVTDGEAAYGRDDRLAETRRCEQQRALAALGIGPTSIHRLSLPDSRVTAAEAELAMSLEELVDHTTLLIAPWDQDVHPDHEATGRAARNAAAKTGAQLAFYFFWSWHQCLPSQILDAGPVRLLLDENLRQRKEKALCEYRSQFERPDGEPILSASLLAPARRGFETFLV